MPNTVAASTPIVPGSGSNVSVLVDGDQVNMDDLYKEVSPGATPKLTLKFLWDWLYLVITTLWGGTGITSSTAYTRAAAGLPSYTLSSGTTATWSQFAAGPGAAGVAWINEVVGGALTWAIGPQDVPNGATLTGATMTFVGATGHAGNFPPATMPTWTILQVANNGVATSLGTVTDASGSTGVYEVAHTLAVTGLSTVIDRSQNSYYAVLVAESGTHSIANNSTGTNAWRPVYAWKGTNVAFA